MAGRPATNGELRVQIGPRVVTLQLPRRVVFGRSHLNQRPRPLGETYLPLASDTGMSREWFCVEDVRVLASLGDDEAQGFVVRCLSATQSLQVWDGAVPVRLQPGDRYLIRGSVAYVGDLVGGLIVGARVEPMISLPQNAAEATGVAGNGSGPAMTQPPQAFSFSSSAETVLMARYHRYYRTPPDFDPQPVPWADVAVDLGMLTLAQAADSGILRTRIKPAQETISQVKRAVDVRYPGWLPAGSETQKTFHDHLRTVLEMHGFFAPDRLAAFDARSGHAP